MMKKYFPLLLIIFFIALVPVLADACPMCKGGGTRQTAFAYKSITAMLASLPLLMGGGIWWWINSKLKSKNKTPG